MTKIEAKQAVSAVDLLKAAVTGTTDPKPATDTAATASPAARRFALPPLPRLDRHRLAIPGAALAVGALLGGGVMALTRSAPSNDAVMALTTTLDAGRTETARLGSDIAQLHQVLADLRASTDTARKEAGTRSSALGERFEQVEREQNARIATLAAQLDRRAPAAATQAARGEPTQTGSLADATRNAEAKSIDAKVSEARVPDAKLQEARISEAKGPEIKGPETKSSEFRASDVKMADAKPADVRPKSAAAEKAPVIDGWALRDIFEGAAILENRRHRLVEVGPGDVVPGVGRVESVERRGREWVVVTRQGLVTPQPW